MSEQEDRKLAADLILLDEAPEALEGAMGKRRLDAHQALITQAREPERKALEEALAFLKRSSFYGLEIVSTARLTELQIANFRAAGMMYVEPGGGLGWVVRRSAPPQWQADQERELAEERAKREASEQFLLCQSCGQRLDSEHCPWSRRDEQEAWAAEAKRQAERAEAAERELSAAKLAFTLNVEALQVAENERDEEVEKVMQCSHDFAEACNQRDAALAQAKGLREALGVAKSALLRKGPKS